MYKYDSKGDCIYIEIVTVNGQKKNLILMVMKFIMNVMMVL